MPSVPQVGRAALEALLASKADKLEEHSLMLVHGRYASGAPARFTATLNGRPRHIRVSDESSVLGALSAWESHKEKASRSDVLVVTTGVDDAQLGWDLRGRAVDRRTLTVEKAEVVLQRFGATALDVRMYRENWLLDALVDAEPAEGGWPRVGGLLTRDTALRLLTASRLGLDRADGATTSVQAATFDADTLLAWSRTPAGPLRFAELSETERTELKKWLGEVAGPAVVVLMALIEAGLGPDAMALGILAAGLRDPAAPPDTALALGGLFGRVMPRRAELAAFTDAVEGTLLRWIADARTGPAARERVFGVLDRADELARTTGLTSGLVTSRFLPVGFTAQLGRTIVEARASPAAGEAALSDLTSHALAGLLPERVQVAEMAVRIARWLDQPEPQVPGVSAGVRAHVAEWGWADRALTVLWAGDPAGDIATARELGVLYEQGRDRRRRLDEQFARRLAAWSAHASARQPEGCLVIENVQETVVRKLAGSAAPLLLVLDGMSSAVAAQLGEEVERDGWREIVPSVAGQAPARLAAVSMLPSVTHASRASLLAGEAVRGGQSVESTGFAAFWKRRRREAALFHKADIGGDAGHVLSHDLMSALASHAVVGVVLNTIDDALDNGQQGRGASWSAEDISYLRELLAAARSYGRPVVLVADHGHVLERGSRSESHAAAGAAEPTVRTGPNRETVSARWRTGATPEEGEVVLSGPRVLEGEGTVVAPWREEIRYTGRRAGYHGGASLAEVTVPVLALVPSPELTPSGWNPLPREQAAPPWWHAPVVGPETGADLLADGTATSATRAPGEVADAEGNGPEVSGAARGRRSGTEQRDTGNPHAMSLGEQVVGSEVYEAQKKYVRKAPDGPVVASVVDALVARGGTMSPAALAAAISATGRVRRNIEGFLATVQRLLNVESYPVLGLVDGGHAVKLDVSLLREQFLPTERS